MNALIIDTSSSHLTVALYKNGEFLYSFKSDALLKHSVTLMDEVDKILTENSLKPNDIDVFCAVLGPGSFTGIRIGVSTVKAFSYATNKKVLGVTSFDVLAYNKRSGKRLAVIDADHGNFYVQGYDGLNIVKKAEFVNTEVLKELSKEYQVLSNSPIDGIETESCDLIKGLKEAFDLKSGEATFDREVLIPLYVRKSNAEENV